MSKRKRRLNAARRRLVGCFPYLSGISLHEQFVMGKIREAIELIDGMLENDASPPRATLSEQTDQ